MKTKSNLAKRKAIKSWISYDWANSVYALVISTAVFPIYFSANSPELISIFGFDIKNSALYTAVMSCSFILISLLSPILSSIADLGGKKKKFMKFFSNLGAVSCLAMYFFTPERYGLALILSFLASIGFSGSLVFYNAYLPELVPKKLQDNVSARGFAMGYLGGAILLISILALAQFHDTLSISESYAYRLGFLLVGLWWLGFSQYSFLHLPANPYRKTIPKNLWKNSTKELRSVWKSFQSHPFLKPYLKAFFLFSAGVQTIILTATLFGGKVLKLPSENLIITILLIQFVAIPGSHLFAYLAKKQGNFKSLYISTFIWMLICLGSFFITSGLQFYLFGGLAGLVLGGIQSVARSTYSKLLPQTEDHTTFFSFFDVLEKYSIVIGTALVAIIDQFIDLKYASLLFALFFISASLILVRLHNKQHSK
ncbi:MAG: MFS transporter [Flavobacteriales bacterium]